ncbi:MAG: FAD:protein FMN transferase [Candidatus Dormibacteraceae bacterium]
MSLESLRFQALGSNCHLLAIGSDEEALASGAAWVGAMHRRLTRFEPDSELSCFNAAAGRWVGISPELEDLLREALRAYRLSGGLVNAGVLDAMIAAGYSRTLAQGPTVSVLDTVTMNPLRALPDILEVAPGVARLRPGYGIDLGGLAKGWMADRLALQIGENSLANLGGDLYAHGDGPQGSGWPVGFGGGTVMLRDQGAATSGTGGRRWGDGLHHLIDPRTGRPSDSDLDEVSVIAQTATDAEILAKTALLLGRGAADYYLGDKAEGWYLHS